MNLHQKLVEVRKSISGFTKDSKSFNYTYVSGTQVLSKIKDKMDELGVLCFPSITSQSHESFHYKDKYNKDKHDFIVFGAMTYRWINADNPEEVLEIPFEYMGQQDDISKAFGSGLTYSERYFLLKFFGVPTDDDDPDAKKQPEKPKDKKQEQPKQEQQKPQKPPVQKAEQMKNFVAITKDTKDLIVVLAEDIAGKRNTDVMDTYYILRKDPNFKLSDLDKWTEDEGKNFIEVLERWIKKLDGAAVK